MPSWILWHAQTFQEVIYDLRSSRHGLSKKDVLKRRDKYGWNELPKDKPLSVVSLLLHQVFNPLIFVLLIASIASSFLNEWVDAGVIFAAIFINTIIGFTQELKADRTLTHLQSLVQPRALVLRDGKEIEIQARELVPGDILLLHLGDQVTADARIIENFDLQINEAALTGESLPISKRIEKLKNGTVLAERTNMVYAGTMVVGGHCRAVVVATGFETEIGKIAVLLSKTIETKTPLQIQLARLAKWIFWLVLGIVVVLFVFGLFTGRGVFEMFEISVALAVAAIPEGLVVSVTIVLAIGMQKILRRGSLVRRLVAAETLGSVSVICSDKTGTLTEGNMRVVSVVTSDGIVDAFALRGQTHRGVMKHLLETIVLCNDAKFADGKDGEIIKGSATESSLLQFASDVGIDSNKLQKDFPRLADIPFDSARKYMVVENVSDGAFRLSLKGAPANVIDFCNLSREDRTKWENQVDDLAKQGLRLIAVASKIIRQKHEHITTDDLSGFEFLGLIALQDPLRADAREQIAAAARAGIRTILVTGDHPLTARTIAKQAGLPCESENIVVGSELDKWSDEELKRRVTRIRIYARVEPRHKIRIVNAWKERGEVVAMTGDGVNDAPALKAADIGIALGSGTDVAKGASDLVLLDNNLGTITSAIREGRVLFDNIRKTIVYLMSDSFTEIVLIAGSLLLGLPVPILPAQILWINLVADSFPNVGLTLEPGERDVMSLPPRPRNEPVVNRDMMTIIFTIGIITDILLFILYIWMWQTRGDLSEIRSIMFAAVGIDSLIYVFAVKSLRQTIFRINPFSNPWLILGVLIGFGLMLLALLHPFFQMLFEVSPLSLSDWVLLLMIALLKLVAIEVAKELIRFKKRHVMPSTGSGNKISSAS